MTLLLLTLHAKLHKVHAEQAKQNQAGAAAEGTK
jgi:hypothetical protein